MFQLRRTILSNIRNTTRFAFTSNVLKSSNNSLSLRRKFASEANVQYEGFEAVVRKYLKKDEHVVVGILGFYFFLGFILTRGGDDKEEPVAKVVAPPTTTESKIPSLFDEEFEEWAKIEGNMEKWEKSLESKEWHDSLEN